MDSSYPSRCQILLPGTLHVPFLTCSALHVLRSQLLGHYHLFDTGVSSSGLFYSTGGHAQIICDYLSTNQSGATYARVHALHVPVIL